MALEHRFGGEWTEEKLARLRKYLSAYTTIFTSNPRASLLRTSYVDAFAGTGSRISSGEAEPETLPLFEDKDAQEFQKGSAQIALETRPAFNRYIFIEQKEEYARELRNLAARFPGQDIRVVPEDANTFLQRWSDATDWRSNRSVVFLDPYGMEVEWRTLEKLASTKAVDLWILFPLGQAVNRLLMRRRPPEGSWAERLTKFFGTDQWKEEFYKPSLQPSLFGDSSSLEREADFDAIGGFFLRRLREVFAGVAPKTLALRNSRNVPIYLLCFAASNPKGAPTAVKIANDILGS